MASSTKHTLSAKDIKSFFSGPLNHRSTPREEMYLRRALNTFDLKPPHYYIKPQVLIEENVEKLVKYVGRVDGVKAETDITNRTEVLRIIDKGKKQGIIPAKVGYEHDAVFSLSVYNVKISRYNQLEELLQRIPMHEISAACYIKDHGQHILALKHGTLSECSLSVLYCDTKVAAEEICALLGQCFHLVYTEITMQLFPLHGASQGSSNSGSTVVYPHSQMLPGFMEPVARSPRRQTGVRSDRSTRDSDGSIPMELVKEYMNNLHQELNPEELRHFAKLLVDWHTALPFHEFCEQVLELYGPDRKHLLTDMSPFIPSPVYPQFVEFLRKNNISLPDNGSLSSDRSHTILYMRSGSERSAASTISNGGSSDDVEQILTDLTQHIERLETSVDVETNPDNFMHGIDNY